MWVIFAFVSATIVGIRDSFKKSSLQGNDVLTVLFLNTLFSAAAALYDKFVMGRPEDGGMGNSVMFIQSWYNIYQAGLLLLILLYRQRSLRKQGQGTVPFRFVWSIVMVSLCEVSADLLYDAALQLPGCLVSILAMVRRGSVVVSFFIGVLFFHEKNLRSKIWDLLLVLLGMLLLYFGSIE